MDMNNPATSLNCTQCGGELHPDEGQIFLVCPYCSATVYVDKRRVVFHWSVAPTLNAEQANAALFRWMSGSQTVKDLDKKSQITGRDFQYFPLWFFKYGAGNREEIALQPAAATSVSELARLNIPAGDLRKYDPALDAESEPPSVPLEAALEWFRQSHPQAEARETALVHVPIYVFKYAHRSQTYTAVVDAASGNVLANIYPAKDEMPFRLVGGVAAAVYLCIASIPVFGAFSGSDGLGTGLLICSGAGLVAAPFLVAWATWVASKV